ncbi:MAG: hypothetical protein ACRD2W_07640 [Acidimicrobiales bacterium]
MVLAVGLGVGSVADHGDPAYSNNKVVEPAVPRLPVEEVTVQMAYAPGESSGWHVHPVNHIIEVVSGDLEAYDAACELRIYGPGTTYVGGTQSHMIRNNGVVAVEMVVKRIESPVAGYSVTRLTPPEGCPVA